MLSSIDLEISCLPLAYLPYRIGTTTFQVSFGHILTYTLTQNNANEETNNTQCEIYDKAASDQIESNLELGIHIYFIHSIKLYKNSMHSKQQISPQSRIQ